MLTAMLVFRFHHTLRQTGPTVAWWCVVVWLGWAASLLLAGTNLDVTEALAKERYGQAAATTVRAWRQLIAEDQGIPESDKLAAANAFFNRRIFYEVDAIVWRQTDYWASPLELIGRGEGDCEDFAIAKYMTLLLMGVPESKLRMVYVKAQSGASTVVKAEAHMVLGYYATPTAEPLILDNLISSIRPASARPDLSPVFSFNAQGLWVGGGLTSAGDPTARLSRWRDLLERMKQEGL